MMKLKLDSILPMFLVYGGYGPGKSWNVLEGAWIWNFVLESPGKVLTRFYENLSYYFKTNILKQLVWNLIAFILTFSPFVIAAMQYFWDTWNLEGTKK